MNIKSIDHVVIPVRDIDVSLVFYRDILGMTVDKSGGRYAVTFGAQKINLHVGKAQFLPAAKNPTFGSVDICFLADGDIEQIQRELEHKGVTIEEGPVGRQGACGDMQSLYFRDPDGNLIEISVLM